MHDGVIADAVLGALRERPGECPVVRVFVRDVHDGPEQLAERIRTHLAGALGGTDRPVPAVEVVLQPSARVCSACGHGWLDADPDPSCPSCGGVPLPRPHDHTVELEFGD